MKEEANEETIFQRKKQWQYQIYLFISTENNECNEKNEKSIIFYLPEESFQIKFNGFLYIFQLFVVVHQGVENWPQNIDVKI